MTTKEMEKYIAYPRVKSTKKGNFFELAKKNIIKIIGHTKIKRIF